MFCVGVVAGEDEVDLMGRMSVLVFEVLERAWAQRDCALIDMKIEFGVDLDGRFWPHFFIILPQSQVSLPCLEPVGFRYGSSQFRQSVLQGRLNQTSQHSFFPTPAILSSLGVNTL